MSNFDFGGYATKSNIKCGDGRIISSNAFKHQDGEKVPLVFHHMSDDLDSILGHAYLEHREDGMYAKAIFNDTESGKKMKSLVKHGDITRMSIHATQLKHSGNRVDHGIIQEVSLVVGGKNRGATIDSVTIKHGVTTVLDDEEGIFHSGTDFDNLYLKMVEGTEPAGDDLSHAENNKTVQDVLDTLNDEQADVVAALIQEVSEMTHSEELEGDDNMANLFERQNKPVGDFRDDLKHSFDKEEFSKVLVHAENNKMSLKQALVDYMNLNFKDKLEHGIANNELKHADSYGIQDIDYLFPDFKTDSMPPDFIKRDTEWVSSFMAGVHKAPFMRIKMIHADITEAEARAKGYTTGNLKKEEVFKLLKRTIDGTTIYKKQKLDRDNILDITDFNVINWMKQEMRVMLNEEIARACLIGDGRTALDEDKIDDTKIIPIYLDNELYAVKITIPESTSEDAYQKRIDELDYMVKQRKKYKGSGNPIFFTTEDWISDMLTIRDKNNQLLFRGGITELATYLRYSAIVPVEVMENVSRTDDTKTFGLRGIAVDLKQYRIGTNSGGQTTMFEQFDIDYNQMKYLMETRMSGGLTKPYSALVFEEDITPPAPPAQG